MPSVPLCLIRILPLRNPRLRSDSSLSLCVSLAASGSLIRMSWQENLLTTGEQIRDLLASTRRIAVLGIKTEAQAGQPSVYVPKYMQDAGFEIVPVPVYYPDATVILGEKVYRKLVDIPGDIDMVDVFRRSPDVAGHIDDIIAKRPKSVWLQLGIRNDAAAEIFAKAGIKVVQDR